MLPRSLRHTASRLGLMLLVSVGSALLVPTGAEAAPEPAWTRTSDEIRVEQRLFTGHDLARRDPGRFGYSHLEPRSGLRWSEELARAARAWSDELARTHDVRHNPDRSSWLGPGTGENIVWVRSRTTGNGRPLGITDPEAMADRMMRLWMDSDGHRDNLRRSRWGQVGIGVTQAADGTVYATAVFRAEQAPSSATYRAPVEVEPTSTCAATAVPVVGDWDASGRDGIGWWCDGQVRLRTAGGTVLAYTYGRAGDVPVVADSNGDGRDTISIVRDGTWHLNDRLAGGEAARTFVYGRVTRGDVPIAGRWDGGARSLPGVVRDGTWHLRFEQAAGAADRSFVYGRLTAGDLPLWGDWNADGRDTAGIVRGGTWYLRDEHRGGPADRSYIFGRVGDGDRPVVGDWVGDGRDTPAIVRGDEWYLRHQHGGGSADATVRFLRP